MERRERVRLPSRAVQRGHEVGPEAFAEGIRPDEGLQLRDELAIAPEAELGSEPLLGGGEPELLEAGDLGLERWLVGQVVERRAAPQLQGAREPARGGGRIVRGA